MKHFQLCHRLLLLLALVITALPVYAADTTQSTTPFGIRVYETGKAPNFTLNDIDVYLNFSQETENGVFIFSGIDHDYR